MKLYDAKGKEYEVPHAIDAKDWISTGKYFVVNPKEKADLPKDTEKTLLSSLGIGS